MPTSRTGLRKPRQAGRELRALRPHPTLDRRAPALVAAMISQSSIIRFARFLVVGIINTAFGYSVFAALYLVSGGMHRMAITVATVIGVAFNYFTTGRLVFANRGLAALGPFVLGYAAVLALNIIAVDLLVDAQFSALVAQLVCLPFIVLCSYLINDRLVFGRRT